MSEEGLGILRVKWPSMNAPARGPAQHHRYWCSPAKMRLGQQVNDLVKGASDEVHELKLGHRTHSGEGCAEASVHDGHLGDRSIDHAFRSEAIDEAVGDLESAAVDADVFSDAKDGGIALHLFPDALPDCLEVGNSCHVRSKAAPVDDCIGRFKLFGHWLRGWRRRLVASGLCCGGRLWRWLFRRKRGGPGVAAVKGRGTEALQLRIPRPDAIAGDSGLVVCDDFLFEEAIGRHRVRRRLEQVERRSLGLSQFVVFVRPAVQEGDLAVLRRIHNHFEAVVDELEYDKVLLLSAAAVARRLFVYDNLGNAQLN